MALPPKVARKQADLALTLIETLEAAVADGQPADVSLRRFYREHPEFGSRDRRFFSELVFSWFRWRGWLAPAETTRCAMAFLLDAHEQHPAVALLAADLQPAGSMSLQAKAVQTGKWLGLATPLLRSLVPDWVPACLHTPTDKDAARHLEDCLAAFQVRPPVWLRAPRGSGQRLLQVLTKNQLPAVQHPLLPDAVQLNGTPDFSSLAKQSPFEVQDLASQCVGHVCAPQPGQQWWDCCAGAGGKSLHLADLLGFQGAVLATDTRPASLQELQRRAAGRRRGVAIERRPWDARRDPAPQRTFDGVLLDAPCSGLGTWGRNPDARWRTGSTIPAARQQLQQKMLQLAAPTVRPGGHLVYAVCTLTASETEEVIAAFLEKHPNFQLEPTPHPLTGEQTDGRIWIWPAQFACNGMFIARMRQT